MSRTRLVALIALCCAATARAEVLSHVEGDVRPVAPFSWSEPSGSLLNAPGAPIAVFALDAATSELDLRSTPGTLVIETPNGTLTAQADAPPVLYVPLRADPASGELLEFGADDTSTCPTGEEPICWTPGEFVPPHDEAVFSALRAYSPDPLLPSRPTGQETGATGVYIRSIDLRSGGSTQYGRRDVTDTSDLLAPLRSPIHAGGSAQYGRRDAETAAPSSLCSFAQPWFCSAFTYYFGVGLRLLDADPHAPSRLLALWEIGAVYQVIEATGDLGPYAGGSVHVIGVEHARGNVAALGIPLVHFPVGDVLDASAPFAAPSLDAEEPAFGIAYATVPELGASATALVASVALAALRASRAGRS